MFTFISETFKRTEKWREADISATLIFQIPEAKKTPTSKQQDTGEQLAMAFLNSPDSDDDVDCSDGDCDEDLDIQDGKINFDVGGDDNGDSGDDDDSGEISLEV